MVGIHFVLLVRLGAAHATAAGRHMLCSRVCDRRLDCDGEFAIAHELRPGLFILLATRPRHFSSHMHHHMIS